MIHVWNIIHEMFAWPNGIVVGNLIASILWATPTFISLHRKLNRHHKECQESRVYKLATRKIPPIRIAMLSYLYVKYLEKTSDNNFETIKNKRTQADQFLEFALDNNYLVLNSGNIIRDIQKLENEDGR